jgi:hypothetical protein
VSMLAYVVIISGPTIVFAEPLFFDCHGTFEHTYPDEKVENHHGPIDWTTQIMIDAERGAVEWLGSKTNDYCARESDWMHGAAIRLMSSTPPPFFASKCQISHPSRNKKRTFGLAASSIGSPARFLPTKE